MEFVKMHNLGNDFIFINEEVNENDIILMCDRYFGIGADGVIVLNKDQELIRIYNSDGSEAKMCGNALLCLGKLYPELVKINTVSGENKIYHIDDYIVVNMKEPQILKGFPKRFKSIPINVISVGNIHVIALVDDVDYFDLENFAKSIQQYINANVNIVSNITKTSFKIRTYEYGADETNACGSGITSSFFVLNKLGLVDSYCEALAIGGSMNVYLENNQVFLKSKPHLVYKGVINL